MKFKIKEKVYAQRIGRYGFVSAYTGRKYIVKLDTGDEIRYSEEDLQDVR